MKTTLSIAGSDSGGGAGIQADIKTFCAHGVFGTTVVTAITAQNTVLVSGVLDVETKMIEQQLDAVFSDIFPDAVKIGMLSSPEIMLAVAGKLQQWGAKNIVLDPVMVAKSGDLLMRDDAVEVLKTTLVPLCCVLTPNIPEAERLTGLEIKTLDDMHVVARAIHKMGCGAVVLKGGHLDNEVCTDLLFDGKNFYTFQSARVKTKNTHGTGCTFSSAIAANLSLGFGLQEAVNRAKTYITAAIKTAPNIGRGNGAINHSPHNKLCKC